MLHYSKLMIFYAKRWSWYTWYQRQRGGHNCSWAGGIQTLLFYEQATGELSKGHCEGKPIWT